MPFAMTYGQAEHGLAMAHEVDAGRLPAFRSRLRNLQRLGIPPGIALGRGRAATYGAGEILLMALALELIQLGLTPERASFVIRENLDRVVLAARIAARWTKDRETDPAMFLWCDPASLSQIWAPEGADEADRSFNYGGVAVLKERLTSWAKAKSQSEFRRLALINLSNVIGEIVAFSEAAGFHSEDVLNALHEWTEATESEIYGDDPKA